MARKIQVKQILELEAAGLSQSSIAAGRHMSKSSVSEVLQIAHDRQICFEDIRDMPQEEAYRLFYPEVYISAGEPRLHGLLAPPSRREPHTAGRLSSPHRFCRQSQLPESNFCVSMAMTRLGCSVSPLTVMSLVTSTRACEKISGISIDSSSCGEKLSR